MSRFDKNAPPWYSALVDINSLKKALPGAIILTLLLIPVVTSSVLDIREQKRNEEARLKMLAELEAQRIAERKAYLMGHFDPAEREDFILIPKEFATLPTPMHLRKEAWEAFVLMRQAALVDGVNLKIASAARNFEYQKGIWEKKWAGETLVEGKDLSKELPEGFDRFKKILEYSAAPGTSRHHWGTDIDIFYATPSFFETRKGKIIYDWLTANAPRFGFCQVYNIQNENRPWGYKEEKWHWSYLPLAKQFTEEYKTIIAEKDLGGFLGAEFIAGQNLINDYVLGLNPECL